MNGGAAMRRRTLWVALGLGLGLCSVTFAETFVDEFTMFGDYDQYLYSTENAQVWYYPTGNGVRYWGTTESHRWASIVYKYDLPFSIENASLDASIYCHHGFDPPAQGSIDVSPDGVDWTTVHLVTPYVPPGDQGGRLGAAVDARFSGFGLSQQGRATVVGCGSALHAVSAGV